MKKHLTIVLQRLIKTWNKNNVSAACLVYFWKKKNKKKTDSMDNSLE